MSNQSQHRRFTLSAVRILMVGLSVVMTASHANATTVAPPDGWAPVANARPPTFTQQGLTLVIGQVQSLNGQSLTAFARSRADQPYPDTRVKSVKTFKRSKKGQYLSTTRKLDIRGRQGIDTFLVCKGRGDTVRTLSLFGTNSAMANFKLLFQTGLYLEKKCLEPFGASVESAVSKNTHSPSPTVSLESSQSDARDNSGPTSALLSLDDDPSTRVERSSPNTPNAEVLPSLPAGLQDIRGVLVFGIQAGGLFGLTDKSIVTFTDGTYTRDIHTVFQKGADSSKQNKPKAWGEWRMHQGEFQLKRHNETAFETTRGSWVHRPGKSAQRLTGCFGRLTSSSGIDYNSGTTVGVARTWCFWPNGRFTHSSTAFGSSNSNGVMASMRAVSPKARGHYRIEGYAAAFVYDDGHRVDASFSYMDDERSHIALNGRRFMGRAQ